VKVVIIHFNAVFFGEDLDAFQYHLLYSKSVVLEAQLNYCLIVAVEYFEILLLGT
jgi:hypothetical protein